MADYIITDTQLTDIADGARHVLQSTEKMSVKEIATNLKAVTPGSDDMLPSFLDGSLTELVSDKITKLQNYIFPKDSLNKNVLTFNKVSLPNLEELGREVFRINCTGEFDVSSVKKINTASFHSLNLWQSPETIFDISNIENTALPSELFSGAVLSNITEIKIPDTVTQIEEACFYSANISSLTETMLNKLTSLVLGYSSFSSANINSNITKIKIKGATMDAACFSNLRTEATTMRFWIDGSKVTTIGGTTSYNAPFETASLSSPYTVEIYTSAESKQDGWSDYFNYTNYNAQATVHYGVSEEEFDAL